jgi:hypothetical protein
MVTYLTIGAGVLLMIFLERAKKRSENRWTMSKRWRKEHLYQHAPKEVG